MIKVANVFCKVMENGEVGLLGGLRFLINKETVQFNVPYYFFSKTLL